jgi:hypothetical protein
MPATAAQDCSVLDEPRWSGSQGRRLAIRFALAALAVGVSYCFRWEFLRFLTSEANLRLDLFAGIHLERISVDTVLWKGVLYRYENPCTFVDVWFGSIPLLWNFRRSLIKNVCWMAAIAAAMFSFNVVRLSFSDLLFAARVPWDLAHNVISGVAYFLVWLLIWTRLRKDLYRSSLPAAKFLAEAGAISEL